MNDPYVMVIKSYMQHIIKPLKEIDTDVSESSLLYAINLFQYFEGLSPEGQKISKSYLSKLYDAFFDYQALRFPKSSPKERTRRQTEILMIMAKMPVSYLLIINC